MKRPVCSFLIALILFTACQNAASGDTLHLPESLESIGDQAFYGVRALREAAVPYGTVSIGELALWFGGPETIGEGIGMLSTAVHEQCRFFSDKYGRETCRVQTCTACADGKWKR